MIRPGIYIAGPTQSDQYKVVIVHTEDPAVNIGDVLCSNAIPFKKTSLLDAASLASEMQSQSFPHLDVIQNGYVINQRAAQVREILAERQV